MKFGYFSHTWGRPGTTPEQRYRELWREIALADRVGFDYAFCVEHHFTPGESWMPSPPLFCAAAALCTERIRVGPMGYVPSLYNPIRIVNEVAALDQALGGRLELGIASGVAPEFFGHFGADFAERKDRTRECVDLLRTAFADSERFDFKGPFHAYSDVTLSFGPVQRPHPPLWIPTRDRRTLRWLAEIGAHTSATMITPRRALAALHRHFVERWRAAGHGDAGPEIGYWTLVHVGDSDDEAVSRAAPHIAHALTKTLGYGRTPASAGPGAELNTATILQRAGDVDFLLDHDLVFVGSPDTVARRIRRAADEGVFNTVLAEMNFGTLTEAEVTRSVRLFADEVAPALRQHSPY